ESRLVEERRFEFATPRLVRARTLSSGKRSGHDRGDEEERQRENLLGIRNDKLMRRRDEEPVKGEEREDARRDRGGPPVRDRDHEDGDEVQHRKIRDGRSADGELYERRRHGHGDKRGTIGNETANDRRLHAPAATVPAAPGIARPAATLVTAAVSRVA